MAKIIVRNQTKKTLTKDGVDYICITDIARQKNPIEPKDVVKNWLRSKNTAMCFCIVCVFRRVSNVCSVRLVMCDLVRY